MAVFDASFLILLLHPDAQAPIDPETGIAVEHARERIEHLVASLEKKKEKIIIPSPALAEFLVTADRAGATYLGTMEGKRFLRISSFDKRAAVELATMTREALAQGDKRGGSDEPYQKVKFDRQIIAITKVEGENTLYSNDVTLKTFAERAGIRLVTIANLDLPEESKQGVLDFPHPSSPNSKTQ